MTPKSPAVTLAETSTLGPDRLDRRPGPRVRDEGGTVPNGENRNNWPVMIFLSIVFLVYGAMVITALLVMK